MASQENLKPLKTLVFSMGIVLIGGTVLLAGLVWKKVAADVHKPVNCPGGHVDLKGRGTIVDSSISGNIMRVTLEKKDGQSETVTIDICSGQVAGSLLIDSDGESNDN